MDDVGGRLLIEIMIIYGEEGFTDHWKKYTYSSLKEKDSKNVYLVIRILNITNKYCMNQNKDDILIR